MVTISVEINLEEKEVRAFLGLKFDQKSPNNKW